ncbi:MAG TPA: hypothetical protein VNG13_11105 [Mycobacteriales bacterium]|nr:hypothetical protein [Mycobacteriales bacterium]
MTGPVDVPAKLDEIVGLIEGARAMPMSASCMVNRVELLNQLEELRAMLPAEMSQARRLLRDRDQLVEEGRQDADRIIAAARDERARLIAKTEVVAEAALEAERLVGDAEDAAVQMRAEVEDYVDKKLANFEIVLNKTLAAVERGRSKLAGQHELSRLQENPDEPELPH